MISWCSNRHYTRFLFATLLLLPCLASMSFAGQPIFFATDGGGTVSLVWQPEASFFPDRGWRLIRMDDQAVIAHWTPTNRRHDLEQVNPDKADSTEKLLLDLPTLQDAQERETALGLITLGSAIDFRLAMALGVGCRFQAGQGSHRYRLEITDRQGSPLKTLWESPPIDGGVVTAPVSPPGQLKGVADKRGILLYWQTPDDSPIPIITYLVQRKSENTNWIQLLKNPLLASQNQEPDTDKPVLIDNKAPLEEEISYRIIAIDLLGRQSRPAEVSVFNPDPQALWSPDSFEATIKNGAVQLSWKERPNPFTSGYIIERTTGRADLYHPITPEEGLARGVTTFTDTDVKAGLNYYYHIRSFDPRGALGSPSTTAAITIPAPPAPRVTNLTAKVNPIQVRLSWQAPEQDVAGYFIEKKPEKLDAWDRVNPRIRVTTSYEDHFPMGALGRFQYRVIAMGADLKPGEPSEPITIELPGHPKVPRPHLQSINSRDGAVNLTFKATGKKELTDKILIVRGNTPRDLGMIIGEPLPGSATAYTDTMVRPGEDYWYGLVAQDRDKHRSKVSDTLRIRVIPKPVPRPDRPDCEYEKEPFRHVVVTFETPDDFLQVSVLRKTGSQDRWTTISDHIGGTDRVVDANPPQSGTVSYAILYRTENGISGQPSEETTLTITP